jgi:hypothetical protein
MPTPTEIAFGATARSATEHYASTSRAIRRYARLS